jgi:hypothetical protein
MPGRVGAAIVLTMVVRDLERTMGAMAGSNQLGRRGEARRLTRPLLIVSVVLMVGGCEAGAPTVSTPGGPSIGTPGTGSTGPSSAPSATGPVSLPVPALRSAAQIVQALGQADLSGQLVVSLLDELGIGLYLPDGTAIRAGDERSDDDLYLFEPEAQGLAMLVRSLGDPDASISFRDFHAGLVGLGYGGSADELARAYAESYAESPDSLVSMLVSSTAVLDADAQIPSFTAWLLVLDGFIAPSPAASAVAMAGPAPAIAAGRSSWGVAASRVQRHGNISPNAGRYIARLMAIAATWTVRLFPESATVHEGHGATGPPVTIKADIAAYGQVFTSPITGNPVVPINFDRLHAGVQVAWTGDAIALQHGSVSAPQPVTDDRGDASATYTPKAEETKGEGELFNGQGGITAAVSKAELVLRIYGPWVSPYVPFVPGEVRGTAQIDIGWHAFFKSPIEILWTDVYAGSPDHFLFEGELKGYDPESVNGQRIYVGTGTVTGGRGAWVACNPGMDDIELATFDATFNAGLNGDGTITIFAYANVDTPLVGVSTGSMTVSLDGGIVQSIPMPPLGELCPHHSFGTLEYRGGPPPDVPFTP